MLKSIVSGLGCGAAAALIVHGLLLAAELAFENRGVYLRQTQVVFPLETYLRLGLPVTLDRLVTGAVWGALLGLLIRSGRLPPLVTGFVLPALGLTILGFSVIVDPVYAANTSWGIGSTGGWWAQALINGTWGFVAALGLIIVEIMTAPVRNDVNGTSLRV
ncbi:hypothetical protein [Falsiroseomonas oryziterrae]|uniref:hypothetical protein n=1 Tax=Falsiroseomonas oryziterrae TaxID=2911368 RepID=UPI001F2F99A2|nr:hypothetical protein [Roseomonas sp. NPKOSM-4]